MGTGKTLCLDARPNLGHVSVTARSFDLQKSEAMLRKVRSIWLQIPLLPPPLLTQSQPLAGVTCLSLS